MDTISRRSLLLGACLLPAALVLARLPGPAAADAPLAAVATYRERIALPPGAVLEAWLEERDGDRAVWVAGAARLAVSGAPPYAIAFPTDVLPPRAAVRARIVADGTVWFTSDPVPLEGAAEPVEILLRAADRADPANRDAPLGGTEWRFVELGGEALPEGMGPATLSLEPEAGRYAASAGCNRFAGAAEIDGAQLRLAPGAATKMACPAPLDGAEARLVAMLAAAATWRIEGRRLEVMDGGGRILARLVAT